MIKRRGITFPILYLFLYKIIKEKSGRRIFITHKYLIELMRRKLYFLPHYLDYAIIKEMQELKLIRKIGNTNNIRYELIGKDIDKLLNQYNSFL